MKKFISKLGDIFTSKVRAIEKLSTNELEDEKIRLQTVQDQFIGEVKNLENKKRALFEEGRKKKSALEKQALAVQIKQIDDEAKDLVKANNLVSRQILVTGKLSQIKRREKLIKSEGLWSMISSIEPEKLEEFMLDVKVKSKQGDAQSKRLLEILGESDTDVEAVDPEVSKIMAAMEETGEEELSEDAWENIEKNVFKTAQAPETEEPEKE